MTNRTHIVRPGLGVIEDTSLPLLPSDMPRPTDSDGAPITFVGQFAAGEISNPMPSFTDWLSRSPRTKVRLDRRHD